MDNNRILNAPILSKRDPFDRLARFIRGRSEGDELADVVEMQIQEWFFIEQREARQAVIWELPE
jgi:hypothetical protein